jgi:salicylate hydroxylase
MDDRRSRQVIVAGAGIAGLCAALAFAERGYAVKLFEQAARIEPIGSGIQLSPNATHILERLGVLDLLKPVAVRPQAVQLKDAATLQELARVPLGQAGEVRWKAPYLVVHRGDLQNALLARVARESEIELVTNARVTNLTPYPGGITASVDVAGKAEEESGFLMLGADGVWSTMRGLSGGPAGSRFSGQLAWRATVAADSPAGIALGKIAAVDCVTAFLHPGFHLVAYPMRGGAAFNLVAFTKGEAIAEGWSRNADPAMLERAMRGTAPALAHIARDAGPWTAWPIHTLGRRHKWTAPGGIALIGDAAHAMTPFAAQGAAMAIEDAATLAGHVAASPADLPGALAAWEKSRRTRIAKVTRRGAFNHVAWHASGPIAMARNFVLRRRPPEQLAADLDWLYGWRPPAAKTPWSERSKLP